MLALTLFRRAIAMAAEAALKADPDKLAGVVQQTLTQATPTIKQLLQSQNQQKALDAFVKDFTKRWKDKTNCRSGFVTQDCKNAPKKKATTTTAPATTSGSGAQGTTTTSP